VDIATILASANRLVARTIDMASVDVSVDSNAGLFVEGRATEIQQVFVNLIKNAIEAVRDEHIGDGGKVQVTAGRGIDHCWVTVEDNGVGIPADVHSQLFDPFYTTKPPGKGTGLGLNVSYRIMTKHRGTITVQSGEEGGTVFRVQFPVEG
jgi:signal transduction histidine kinase